MVSRRRVGFTIKSIKEPTVPKSRWSGRNWDIQLILGYSWRWLLPLQQGRNSLISFLILYLCSLAFLCRLWSTLNIVVALRTEIMSLWQPNVMSRYCFNEQFLFQDIRTHPHFFFFMLLHQKRGLLFLSNTIKFC